MKNNKKPLIIILVMVLTIVAGLLLANYMFKQVDIKLEEKNSTQSFNYEKTENLYVIHN